MAWISNNGVWPNPLLTNAQSLCLNRSLLRDETCIPAQMPSIDEPIRAKSINPDLQNTKDIAAILSTGFLVAEQYVVEHFLTKASQGDEQGHQTLNTFLAMSLRQGL
ncbi:hypothetical protein LTR49_028685, partial [Elasticomyces elasticus]